MSIAITFEQCTSSFTREGNASLNLSIAAPVLLVLDNYDSFTYNLVQYFGELGEDVAVYRNDTLSVSDVAAMAPDAIVISPGPCTPSEAGISVPLIRTLGEHVPILGVCLGHQAIGEAFGGRVIRAGRVMHGKTSQLHHRGAELFEGLPSPLKVMRYHSLVVDHDSLPEELEITAFATDDPREIHALRHRLFPVWGVQFHPESIMTEGGMQLLRNFLGLARAFRARSVAA
jgi:anthranilate synthase component II